MKDITVITIITPVLHVLTNVTPVLMPLITVLLVSHQELEPQNVDVQKVSSITETLVLLVPITVLPVKTETNVPLVTISELTPQLVNVHPDTSILVKPNVNCVT
jgi:hypothetical protein